jgi:hypothetical protein
VDSNHQKHGPQPCAYALPPYPHNGQGWIRTTEFSTRRRIYSPLVSTAHPPVHIGEQRARTPAGFPTAPLSRRAPPHRRIYSPYTPGEIRTPKIRILNPARLPCSATGAQCTNSDSNRDKPDLETGAYAVPPFVPSKWPHRESNPETSNFKSDGYTDFAYGAVVRLERIQIT